MIKTIQRWPLTCQSLAHPHYVNSVPLAFRLSATTRRHIRPLTTDSTPTSPTKPLLSGIKILDLTRVLAGPFCTQILADYGASVLKVEQPGTGDETRQWRAEGEARIWKHGGLNSSGVPVISCYYAAINRNKRSLTLNLKSEKGKEIVKRLAREADVVVNNFLPGKMEGMGLGYEELRKGNGGLVYASISGYGATGPSAQRGGYDAVVGAEAGLLHITGEQDGSPVKPGIAIADLCTGLYMHGAIVSALLGRERNGGMGTKIEGSLFESVMSLLTNVASSWLNLGKEGKRWGMGHPSLVPYGGFETKNGGWLFVAANNNRQWKLFCEMVKDEDLSADERYRTNDGRVAHRVELEAVVQKRFKTKTLNEWLKVFEGGTLPYGPVNTIEGAFAHPQAEARNMVESVEFEGMVDGVLRLLGIPSKGTGYL